MIEADKNPLVRLPGEPLRWYDFFLSFAHSGPGRSFLGTYNQRRKEARKSAVQTIPGAWQKAVKVFKWRERAQEFDRAQFAKEEKEFSKALSRERKRRFSLLRNARIKLSQAVKVLGVGMSWREVFSGIKAVFPEFREDFESLDFEERLKKLETANK